MEKKNTVLLTVIAVATLLVAVVGATFAYFTATTTPSGNGGSADVTTTTVGSVDLKMAPVTITNELKYPGGKLVVGASVTGKDTDTAIDFDTTYTVKGTITNNTKTELTWALYEISTEATTPISGCTVNEDSTTQPGETRYSYTGCTVDAAILAGTKVANGTVAAATTTGEGESAVTTAGTATIAAANETLTTSNAGTATYYYLVVDYPDNGNQNDDQNKQVVAQLTGLDAAVAVEHK